MGEKVLVVHRNVLFKNKIFQGFLPIEEFNFLPIITKNAFFVDRQKAEKNSSLKQIIPYQILLINDKIFVYKRVASENEKRYIGKYSIGIGGHINPEDGIDLIEHARQREFSEEIEYRGKIKAKLIGFINDDYDDLGKVHFGLAYLLIGNEEKLNIREKEKIRGKLINFRDAKKVLNKMESWSKIVYEYLAKGR